MRTVMVRVSGFTVGEMKMSLPRKAAFGSASVVSTASCPRLTRGVGFVNLPSAQTELRSTSW